MILMWVIKMNNNEKKDFNNFGPDNLMIEETPSNFIRFESEYRSELAKKITFFNKKGISKKMAIIIFVVFSALLVGYFFWFYLYQNFQYTSTLINKLSELEQEFYNYEKLKNQMDELIDTLDQKSDLSAITSLFGINNSPGNYDISYKGSSENVTEIVKKIFSEPKIQVNNIEIKSGFGFPILPKNLESEGANVELSGNLTILNFD